LQAQAESLQVSNEFKDQLFSIIGHDLRSPLVGVNGIFELRQEGLLDDEEFLNVLPDVAQNIYQVTNLTENLLFWAKSQIKGQFLRLENLDLHSFANNQVDLFRTQTLAKNILLVNQVPYKTMVLADSNMLDLVLRNLVGNAVKFCKDCDIITISATKTNSDTFLVCVSDTGVGMSQENVDKLFGSFVFTLRGTSNEKGTGLGLKLCKEFVEKNGGTIWVESELGKGSKFFFTLKVSYE
jgi:two-component system, sensor histidine kinase and response regulator